MKIRKNIKKITAVLMAAVTMISTNAYAYEQIYNEYFYDVEDEFYETLYSESTLYPIDLPDNLILAEEDIEILYYDDYSVIYGMAYYTALDGITYYPTNGYDYYNSPFRLEEGYGRISWGRKDSKGLWWTSGICLSTCPYNEGWCWVGYLSEDGNSVVQYYKYLKNPFMIYANTTIDGKEVDSEGCWVIDGVRQTRTYPMS